MKKIHTILSGTKKGYALLFAVLVSALVLAIGVSILNISRKELILTSGGRNSEYAFYAADSGYECAIYYDYQGASGNGSTFFSTTTFASGAPQSLACGTSNSGRVVDSTVTMNTTGSGANTQYDFIFNFPLYGNSCTSVDVNKIYNNSTGVSTTTVSSLGYNIGWEGTSPNGDCGGQNNNAEKVDRELVTTYSGT